MYNIIGGSGFVGTSFCKRLFNQKIPFTILDLNHSKLFPNQTKIVNICDKDRLSENLTGSVVINLAATHRDDIDDPNQYYLNNVEAAKTLCDVCEEKGINKIIFTSSVAVYGFVEGQTSESGEMNPFNEYGRTKALAEEVYRSWQQKDPRHRKLVIIRPTVIFGEGNRGNVFNLFNLIYRRAFVMIGNGNNKKSIAYVENVSAFLFRCLNEKENYALYNYVDSPNLTMNELVIMVRRTLFNKNSIRFRLPKSLGLFLGYCADLMNKIGVNVPMSSIRVKKFCSSSEFSTIMQVSKDFNPPFKLEEAIERTLMSEFIKPDPNRPIYYTE